jgi:ribose 5-phosphate isomerase A
MRELGLKPALRRDSSGREFLSDNGNAIIDCAVAQIDGPARLERSLLSIPGVVGTGLFLGIADMVIVAGADGAIRTLRSRR